MSSEEELQNKLEKLEIAPTQRHIELFDGHRCTNAPGHELFDGLMPLSQNPFFNEVVDLVGKKSDRMMRKNITNSQTSLEYCARSPNCRRCRQRRQSTSVLDEHKSAAKLLAASPELLPATSTRATPGVQRQPLKKSPIVGANKKILLREPVLRALQVCCFSMTANVRRKLLSPTTSVSPSVSASSSGGNEISAVRPAGEQSNDSKPLPTREMTDFRDLVSECQNLLEHDVEFGGRLRTKAQLNSKNFTTMQTHTAIAGRQTRTVGRRHSFSDTPAGTDDFLLSKPSTRITSRTSSPLPEQSSVSRATTSCSQQAGNRTGAASCDDVTIDELASYFDTLVHIPKKMSSMAEMMYI